MMVFKNALFSLFTYGLLPASGPSPPPQELQLLLLMMKSVPILSKGTKGFGPGRVYPWKSFSVWYQIFSICSWFVEEDLC